MAYCTIQDLRELLPKNLTIGTSTGPSVSSPNASTISVTTANRYIYFANQFVDSRLSSLYVSPLRRIKRLTIALRADMLPSSTDVVVTDVTGFYTGGLVEIMDSNGSEEAIISDIPETITAASGATVTNFTHLTLAEPTANAYDADSEGTVSLLTYPDPLPVMTARFAAAMLFDKIFVAEQEPDISNYGKSLRSLAVRDMNAILAGQIRLMGQDFASRRFVRNQLFDVVRLPTDPGVTIDQGVEG